MIKAVGNIWATFKRRWTIVVVVVGGFEMFLERGITGDVREFDMWRAL